MCARCLALFAFLLVYPSALPAQEKAKAPTLVLHLQSLDDVVADLRFLAEQVGRGEEAVQAEKLLKSLAGDKGLEGLDTKKPMGLYAFLASDVTASQLVLLLPVADEQTRGIGHMIAESIFDSKHTIFLRERMGPDFVYKP